MPSMWETNGESKMKTYTKEHLKKYWKWGFDIGYWGGAMAATFAILVVVVILKLLN